MVRQDIRSGVMTVALDDVVADEPSERAADQHVGGKVLLAKNAGEANAGGAGVERRTESRATGYSAASADAADEGDRAVCDEGNG